MANYIDLDYEMELELTEVRQHFVEAAAHDERLGLLLMVDPIRAFREVGAELSPRTQAYLRQQYPGMPFDNEELFHAVLSGDYQIPWVVGVRAYLAPDPAAEGDN